MKDEGARGKPLGYPERKGDWILCHSLRRRLGLRNSGNGVVLADQQVVSQRKKQPHMSRGDDMTRTADTGRLL